jgi:beta-glucosidase
MKFCKYLIEKIGLLVGLHFYVQLCDALLEAGIKPLVTLYHWDLPTALYRKGGWKNPESPAWFEEYTELLAKALGDRAYAWMTFNEPQMFVGLGMLVGAHAPFEHNDDKTLAEVSKNVLLAHGRAVSVLRRLCPKALIGMAPTGDCYLPKDETPESIEEARRKSTRLGRDFVISNTWWADPIFLGKAPEDAEALLGENMYRLTAEEWASVSQKLDFYGFNCYQGTQDYPPPEDGYNNYAWQGSPKTGFGWNFTPQALYYSSKFWYERYGLPVLITENGYAGTDHVMLDGKVHDPQRQDWMHRYLLELRRAVDDGIQSGSMGSIVWTDDTKIVEGQLGDGTYVYTVTITDIFDQTYKPVSALITFKDGKRTEAKLGQ